ncbi:hypothetical protein DERP_012955 [Dermatophagoides pteronyssinus]|uniref:Uncharacterized protein n=1 Tax=Dermatophagoides pteronyssinus TaxID=6956 RepID=A0ABQ8ISF1_DERPT|nr:hypothetical protein DERP_012955 [Dermatophagoides pteronyssinus]
MEIFIHFCFNFIFILNNINRPYNDILNRTTTKMGTIFLNVLFSINHCNLSLSNKNYEFFRIDSIDEVENSISTLCLTTFKHLSYNNNNNGTSLTIYNNNNNNREKHINKTIEHNICQHSWELYLVKQKSMDMDN